MTTMTKAEATTRERYGGFDGLGYLGTTVSRFFVVDGDGAQTRPWVSRCSRPESGICNPNAP
jgi:hypothetical protein